MSKFEARVRFNWGFHDGASPSRMKVDGAGVVRDRQWGKDHFDEAYGCGFVAGLDALERGQRTDTSDAAWEWMHGKGAA